MTPPADVLDGRYELGPVVGTGGMGVVRRAVDRRLDRHVAVKLLRADLAAQPSIRQRFEDEARSAARLSHPAVVTVFDSGEDGDDVYLVMECLSGRTLADELAGGPIPAERVRVYAEALLGALQAAHSLGIIHRDVKPGNVLLTDDGRVKLGDFGIAKTTEGLDLTSTGMIIGTPAYLAPERLAGHPATAASDQYALAVTLYEALTGEKPFLGETPMALATAMQTGTPIPVTTRCPGVDPRLAYVIDRAMAREPSDRFVSSSDMLDALRDTAVSAVSAVASADATTRLDTAPATATMVAVQPAPLTASEGLVGGAPVERARTWWARRNPVERRAAMGVVAVVVLLLVAMAIFPEGDGEPPPNETPATSAPAAGADPLPQPLDDAIDDLETAITP